MKCLSLLQRLWMLAIDAYTGHAYNENRLKPVVGFCGAFNTNNVHMPTTVIQFIHLIVYV